MALKLDNVFNKYDSELNICDIQEIIFLNIPNLWFLGNEGKKIEESLGNGIYSKLRLIQIWIALSNSKENRRYNVLVHDFVVINCELNSIALHKMLGKREDWKSRI